VNIGGPTNQVNAWGTFTMYGGVISGNTAATNGGGVRRGANTNAVFTMYDGEITDNTAARDGGGIYAQGEVYSPVLSATNYARITIGPNVVFSGNRAGTGAFHPPDTTAVDNRIQTTSSTIFNHPINNFDINFRYGPRAETLTITYVTNTAQGIFSPPGATDLRTETIDIYSSLVRAPALLHPSQVPDTTPMTGYVFDGWTKDGGSTLLTYDQVRATVIRNDTTFTAQWSPAETGPRPPGPPEPPPAPPITGQHYAYLIGFEDGTIRPGANVSRAQAATILFRLMSDEDRATYWRQTNPYSDVTIDDWFNNSVSTTTSAGLFQGLPDGTFRPNRAVTRAELAAAITRMMGVTETGAPLFNDTAGHWARDYISAAALGGWLLGYDGPDGRFLPDQPISRAEAAAMINRALWRLPESSNDLLPDMRRWPDNAVTGAWYYLYIQEATNSHYYVIKEDGIHETWEQLIPPRPWALLELPGSRPEDIFRIQD